MWIHNTCRFERAFGSQWLRSCWGPLVKISWIQSTVCSESWLGTMLPTSPSSSCITSSTARTPMKWKAMATGIAQQERLFEVDKYCWECGLNTGLLSSNLQHWDQPWPWPYKLTWAQFGRSGTFGADGFTLMIVRMFWCEFIYKFYNITLCTTMWIWLLPLLPM